MFLWRLAHELEDKLEESEIKPQRRKDEQIKEKEGSGVQERGIEREEGNGFFK